jgi:hypothetical protein
MRIESIQSNGQPAAPDPATAARERAIAKLMEGAPMEQTRVAPENISAVSPPPVVSDPMAAEAAAVKAQESASKEEGDPAAVSTDKVEPSQEATKEEPLSSQYAQLARREKAIRAQMLELKRQREEFQKERQTAEQPAATSAAPDLSKYVSKEELAKDPWTHLNDAGVSYDALTQQALNQPAPELLELRKANAVLMAKVEKLEESHQQARKEAENQQAQAYQQAVAQIEADVRTLVDTDASFELVKATNSQKDVVKLITDTFKAEKRLMTVEEASKEVEEYLLEALIPIAKSGKIQQKLKPAAPPAPKQEPPKQPQPTKTLTNAIGSQRPLTARERAIAAMNGEMKK